MVIKRLRDNKLFMYLGVPASVVSVITVLVVCSKTVTVYAELPNDMQETKQEVKQIDSYIKEQQISQKMLEKLIAKDAGPKISDDGKLFFDESKSVWQPIKLLKKYMETK